MASLACFYIVERRALNTRNYTHQALTYTLEVVRINRLSVNPRSGISHRLLHPHLLLSTAHLTRSFYITF